MYITPQTSVLAIQAASIMVVSSVDDAGSNRGLGHQDVETKSRNTFDGWDEYY